jgi:thiol-disulfide isomerase/thioredoxin
MSDLTEIPPPSNAAALTRWLLLVGLTFAVLAAGFYWISTAVPADRDDGADVGYETSAALPGAGSAPEYPAPEFRLATLDGRSVGPPDFAGKVVVIEFWATWCGPCKLQAQMFEKAHEEHAGDGVEFMAINIGEDAETVREYVTKKPFPYPVLLDPEEQLMGRYRIFGLPTVMVVDRGGQVSFLRTGLTDVPTLRREIAKAADA